MEYPLAPDKHKETRSARWKRRFGLAAAGLVLGGSTAAFGYSHSEGEAVIAGYKVEISPTFDERLTFDNGLFPDVRTPLNLPLGQGVMIDVGNSAMQTTSTNSKQASERIVATLSALADRPEAEIGAVMATLRHEAAVSGAVGFGAALVPAGLSALIGARRRQELAAKLSEQDTKYGYMRIGAAVLMLTAAVGSAGKVPIKTDDMREVPFVALSSVVPISASIPELQNVEIRDVDLTVFGADLIQGAVASYDQSKEFYNSVIDRLSLMESQFHTPEDDEQVAIVYSDRHDNIGTDKVIGKLIDLSGASKSIGVGDDTSSGAPWEVFSLRSIDRTLKDLDRAAIVGNHDVSKNEFVKRYLESNDFMTADGDVQTFGDSSILLVDDHRSSGFTPERAVESTNDDIVRETVADTACDYGRVNLLVVAKASLATEALSRGCIDLAISADSHVQTYPELVSGGEDGSEVGYTVTNGTSGGAAFAFAAGSKYRRDAAFTLVTVREGVPVGEQHVIVGTNGVPTISTYAPLLPSSIYSSEPAVPNEVGVAGR